MILFCSYYIFIYICSVINKQIETMTTIKNTSGTKAVNITNNNNVFKAMYVQLYNGDEQVLESKDYSTFKMAEKWANKKLN